MQGGDPLPPGLGTQQDLLDDVLCQVRIAGQRRRVAQEPVQSLPDEVVEAVGRRFAGYSFCHAD